MWKGSRSQNPHYDWLDADTDVVCGNFDFDAKQRIPPDVIDLLKEQTGEMITWV